MRYDENRLPHVVLIAPHRFARGSLGIPHRAAASAATRSRLPGSLRTLHRLTMPPRAATVSGQKDGRLALTPPGDPSKRAAVAAGLSVPGVPGGERMALRAKVEPGTWKTPKQTLSPFGRRGFSRRVRLGSFGHELVTWFSSAELTEDLGAPSPGLDEEPYGGETLWPLARAYGSGQRPRVVHLVGPTAPVRCPRAAVR